MSFVFASEVSRQARRLVGSRVLDRLAIASNWPIYAAVAVLSTTGVVTIFATSPDHAKRQLVYLAIAVVCLLAFQWINYQRIGRFAWAFYGLSFLPLYYTVMGSMIGGENPLPGVIRLNGAYNWIRVAGISIQPAEVMKIAFIMALATYLKYRANYRSLTGLLLPFALCLVPVFLILKQPDLGTALVFAPTLLAMLFVAGAKLKHIVTIIAIGVLMLPVMWLSGQEGVPVFEKLPSVIKTYQRERVVAMFHNDAATLRGVGFQQQSALMALGSGGIAGKGAGVIPVGQYVPEGENDMIFALIGEQFGFIGCLGVIVAYVVLFAAGIEVASSTREPFGRLVAVGLVAILASQASLNIAVAIKLFPVTGVTLPFVSAGGSSLIASFMAAGLLLNIGQNRPLVMADDSFEFGD